MWERGGKTTRSFDRWAREERQLRSFFSFGLIFGSEGMARQWEEIESTPSDGSEETIDIFDREMDGLGQLEFEWMLGAATIKDAVTLYEVYLEQAASEVLLRHHLEWMTTEAPRWPDLRRFFSHLGVDLYLEDGVGDVRRLRHLLTHRRGALEGQHDRVAYGSDFPFAEETVELTSTRVTSALDILARSVRGIDVVAYDYSWGSERVAALQELRAALPDDEAAS